MVKAVYSRSGRKQAHTKVPDVKYGHVETKYSSLYTGNI